MSQSLDLGLVVGRGITSITRTAGNGAPGTVDTYTITYSDNTTSQFQVANGQNGNGSITVDAQPVEASTNPVASGGVFTALAAKQDSSEKAVANGLATLDSFGKLTAKQAACRIVTVSASRRLELDDANSVLVSEGADPITLTLATHGNVAFPIGTRLEIFRGESGTVTIAGSVGVVIRCTTTARSIEPLYGTAVLRKINNNVWILTGSLG